MTTRTVMTNRTTIFWLCWCYFWLAAAFILSFVGGVWAQEIPPAYAVSAANRRLPVLPPAEYDHPYTKGKLVIVHAKSEEEVRALCPKVRFTVGYAIGCTDPYFGGCKIIIAPESVIRARGWTPEIVIRHERGHCLNWPASHPNGRSIDQVLGVKQ